MRLEAPIGIVATTYIRQVLADEHRSALDVISGWDIERHRTTLDESRDDKRDLDARATNVEAQTHQAWRRRRVNSKSMMNSQETAVGRKTAEGLLYSVPLRKFRGGFHVASHSVQSAPTVSRAMIHEVENTASPLERKKPASKFSMRQKTQHSTSVITQAERSTLVPVHAATGLEGAVKHWPPDAATDLAKQHAGTYPRNLPAVFRCEPPSVSLTSQTADSITIRDNCPLYVVRLAQSSSFSPPPRSRPSSLVGHRFSLGVNDQASPPCARIHQLSCDLPTVPPTCHLADRGRSALQHSHDCAVVRTANPVFIESGSPFGKFRVDERQGGTHFIAKSSPACTTQEVSRIRTHNRDAYLDLVARFMLDPDAP